MTAAVAASWGGQLTTEHDWWVRRRAEYNASAAKGLPSATSTYALAAFDGQVRYRRALWWSAGVFAAFAWIAAMRATAFDWGAAGALGSAATWTVVQSALILLVGVTAACAFAAWASGADAWRATLINSVFWVFLAVAAAWVAVVGAEYGLWLVNVLCVGTILVTLVAPLRDTPTRAVPRG